MAAAVMVSVDGLIVEPAEARISVLDDGLLRGDGVFEAIKLYEGHPFRLAEHLDRLRRSAAALELDFDRDALETEIDALLGRVPADEAMLRLVITRGGRRIAIVEELPEWPPNARIALVPLSPSEILAGVKSISYAANMQSTRIAQRNGADEAVFIDREGVVLEAPTSSIFWVADGELRTPALDCGILDSITRRVLVERLEVVEGRFGREQLAACEEAFLASTTREIQPVAAVDGGPLGSPTGGEAADAARDALEAAVAAERAGG